jgi:hypothetical protein
VLPRIPLVPDPIEGLGHDPELDDEFAEKVSRLDVAALFRPQVDRAVRRRS